MQKVPDSTFMMNPGSTPRGARKFCESITSGTQDDRMESPDESDSIRSAEACVEKKEMENYDPSTKQLKKLWEEKAGENLLWPFQKLLILGADPTKIDETKRYGHIEQLIADFLEVLRMFKLEEKLRNKMDKYEQKQDFPTAKQCRELLDEIRYLTAVVVQELELYKDVKKFCDQNEAAGENINFHEKIGQHSKLFDSYMDYGRGNPFKSLCIEFIRKNSIQQNGSPSGHKLVKTECDLFLSFAEGKMQETALEILATILESAKALIAEKKRPLKALFDAKNAKLCERLEELIKYTKSEQNLFSFLVVARQFWRMGHENVTQNCQPKKMFAVALDGGGIRGLITGVILRFVAGRLFGSDKSIKEKFHWFIGTSTGGIIALCLTENNKPKTPSQCVEFYWKLKGTVFYQSRFLNIGGKSLAKTGDQRWFRMIFPHHENNQTQYLTKALKNQLSEEQCFTHSTITNVDKEIPSNFVPRIAITSFDATKDPGRLKLFRNYRNKDVELVHVEEHGEIEENIKLHEIAQATSAAPTYFSSFKHKKSIGEDTVKRKYLDGGLSANCPLNALLKEIDQIYPNMEEQNEKFGGILSIGTGHKARQKSTQGRFSLPELLAQQATGEDRLSLSCAKARCQAQKIKLLRLSPENIETDLDETDERHLIHMLWNTVLYLCDKRVTAEIDDFAQIYRA